MGRNHLINTKFTRPAPEICNSTAKSRPTPFPPANKGVVLLRCRYCTCSDCIISAPVTTLTRHRNRTSSIAKSLLFLSSSQTNHALSDCRYSCFLLNMSKSGILRESSGTHNSVFAHILLLAGTKSVVPIARSLVSPSPTDCWPLPLRRSPAQRLLQPRRSGRAHEISRRCGGRTPPPRLSGLGSLSLAFPRLSLLVICMVILGLKFTCVVWSHNVIDATCS